MASPCLLTSAATALASLPSIASTARSHGITGEATLAPSASTTDTLHGPLDVTDPN
eukprot:CAMPEP_0173466852 /NCGR_PEP_ID=MMETSP1357-20121228/74047_1 /TAXON_ID=77926 /ORGANISM="Hemiselmis rufescens, Strain PCC563" /LENGTH=55 /DNA_ID=CAMNT_0014434939 /DNA_START=78 /DNA_END=243 /DNA_ORIENTATION=+